MSDQEIQEQAEPADHFHPNQLREVPPPTVKCEVCGEVIPEPKSHSYRIVATHNGEGMPAMACGANQHFGCCPEHAEIVFLRCWNEHMKPGIEALKAIMQPPPPKEDEFGEDIVEVNPNPVEGVDFGRGYAPGKGPQ